MKHIIQSKCLPFIAMFSFLICLCIRIFGTHTTLTFINVEVNLSTLLFFPIWCVLNDIIAEIYGYKIARNLLMSSFLCLLLFSLFSYLSIMIINTHSHSTFEHEFDNMTLHVLYSFLVFMLSWRFNIFFLLKWKRILNSKYFILRSIGSSSLAIIVSVVLLDLYYNIGNSTKNIEVFFVYIVITILFRILLTSLLTFPAYLAIACIRTIDSEYLNSGTPVLENPFLKKENSIAQ